MRVHNNPVPISYTRFWPSVPRLGSSLASLVAAHARDDFPIDCWSSVLHRLYALVSWFAAVFRGLVGSTGLGCSGRLPRSNLLAADRHRCVTLCERVVSQSNAPRTCRRGLRWSIYLKLPHCDARS